MKLGDAIRSKIRENGMKQIEVCKALSLSPSRLSNYLSGTREPDIQTLARICGFLGTTIDSLVGLTVEDEKHPAEVALTALNMTTEAPILVIRGIEINHRIVVSRDTAKAVLSDILKQEEQNEHRRTELTSSRA